MCKFFSYAVSLSVRSVVLGLPIEIGCPDDNMIQTLNNFKTCQVDCDCLTFTLKFILNMAYPIPLSFFVCPSCLKVLYGTGEKDSFSYPSPNIIAVKSHTAQNPSQINEVTEEHHKKPLYIP